MLAAWVTVRLSQKLDRPGRSDGVLTVRGAAILGVLMILAVAIGIVLEGTVPAGGDRGAAMAAVLVIALGARAAFDRARSMARARAAADAVTMAWLDQLPEPEARGLIAAGGQRHGAMASDPHGWLRGAIDNLAIGLDRGLAGPVAAALALGFVGISLYLTATAAAAALQLSGRHPTRFARPSLIAARILAFPGSLMASLALILAAMFVPGARPLGALAGAVRAAAAPLAAPAEAMTLGTMAGTLGIVLSGPRGGLDGGRTAPWIGLGSARAGASDLKRALVLQAVAALLTLAGLAAAFVQLLET